MKFPQALSFIFLLFPFFIAAQTNSSIDLSASLDYGYRFLKLKESDRNSTNDFIINNRKSELAKLNWRSSLHYNQKLHNNLYLKLGISWLNEGYSSDDKSLIFFDSGVVLEAKIKNNYSFIEVPLVLRYELWDRKWTPYAEIGCAVSTYIFSRNVYVYENERSTQQSKDGYFYNFHATAITALGTNYNINEHFQLYVQTAFRIHFSPLVEAPIKEYLYNFGLELGGRYCF